MPGFVGVSGTARSTRSTRRVDRGHRRPQCRPSVGAVERPKAPSTRRRPVGAPRPPRFRETLAAALAAERGSRVPRRPHALSRPAARSRAGTLPGPSISEARRARGSSRRSLGVKLPLGPITGPTLTTAPRRWRSSGSVRPGGFGPGRVGGGVPAGLALVARPARRILVRADSGAKVCAGMSRYRTPAAFPTGDRGHRPLGDHRPASKHQAAAVRFFPHGRLSLLRVKLCAARWHPAQKSPREQRDEGRQRCDG